jgi:hypothetical protein
MRTQCLETINRQQRPSKVVLDQFVAETVAGKTATCRRLSATGIATDRPGHRKAVWYTVVVLNGMLASLLLLRLEGPWRPAW